VHLDGLGSHEERLRDLRVRESGGGVLGDPALAGGERGDPGLCRAAYAEPGGGEFLAGALGERDGARSGCEVHAVAQRITGVRARAEPAQRCAEIDEGVGVLEASGGALELRDRLVQKLEAGPAALDEAATSERLADGTRGVEPPRGGQQRLGLGPGLIRLAEEAP
jgi:hypothetical protein